MVLPASISEHPRTKHFTGIILFGTKSNSVKGGESRRVEPFGKKKQLISDPGISPKRCQSLPELSPIALRGTEQKQNIRPLGGRDR